MKLTNKNNLPDAIVRAIKNDNYSKGDADFSITELLTPPRIVQLKKLHAHEIEEDVEDGLYRLYGQIAHGILERANMNDLAEKRFFGEFLGQKVSGQIDTLCLSEGVLSDFKFTSAWGFKTNQPPKPEWVAQLNMQLELLRLNGLDAKALQIIGLIRDFNLRQSREYPDSYPSSPIVVQSIEMWDRERTQSFIKARIAIHLSAKEKLPLCTSEERWADPDSWAVVKGSRAIPGGIQFSEETAQKLCSERPGTRVEFRPGASRRCESYCPVSEFCTQYQSTLKKRDEDAV